MPCIDENSKELLFSCRWLLCNEGFIPAMRMHLVGGRNFTPSSNPLEAIVNETYVRMRGWTPEQALGHQITDDSSPGAPLYTIVGVVKDFRTVVATGEVEPIVFHPFSYFQKFGATDDYMLDYFLMIRLRGCRRVAEAVQRKIGEYPSGNNHTLEVYDNKLGPILFEIRSFRNIVFTVSGITLLIALMGLVGYLGDEMRRRSKEIALRKVNGASTGRRAAPVGARRAVDRRSVRGRRGRRKPLGCRPAGQQLRRACGRSAGGSSPCAGQWCADRMCRAARPHVAHRQCQPD